MRFSREMINNNQQLAVDIIKSETSRTIYYEMKKGYRVMNLSAISFSIHDRDNFIRNLVTAYINAEIFKIPRFVKRYLSNRRKPYI